MSRYYLIDTGLYLPGDHELFNKVLKENIRQIGIHGIQTRTPFEWITYTTEELGSLAKAISEFEYRKGSKNKVVAEAIQVATLVLKIAKMVKAEDKR